MAYYQSLRDEGRYARGRDQQGQSGWIANRLLRLRRQLSDQITKTREPKSLIIGSWNIRHFDGGRERLPESFHYIAEIIDPFDICAIQEVTNIVAMKQLMRLLGGNWDYFINDSSDGGRGNHERMAFVYYRNKVQFRNLIGELVLPMSALPGGEQVGRSPPSFAYMLAFKSSRLNAKTHICYTNDTQAEKYILLECAKISASI